MDVTDSPPGAPVEIGPVRCTQAGALFARLGDKWAVRVMMSLSARGLRHGELKARIPGISQRMLALTLRKIERDGLVRRLVTPSIPPRVDYELTSVGRSLIGPIRALGEWAWENFEQIDAARRRYDETPLDR